METTTKIGYARRSTTHQDLSIQLEALRTNGCEHIFSEQMSGKTADRPELMKLQAFVRKGDEVIVTKIDRLARSVKHLLQIVDDFRDRGIGFKSLDMDIDYKTPSGRLCLSILGSVAEFERTLTVERISEGVAKARAAGKYKGRKPKSKRIHTLVSQMLDDGIARKTICRELDVSLSFISKVVREMK